MKVGGQTGVELKLEMLLVSCRNSGGGMKFRKGGGKGRKRGRGRGRERKREREEEKKGKEGTNEYERTSKVGKLQS